MAAAKSILEPIFEAYFLPCSFGFRPKRSAHQALEVVRTTVNQGAVWALDADMSDCFGSLSFEAIMGEVSKRVSDRKMLKLIRGWLRVGVLEGGVVTEQVAGAPQGSPVSPLLANVVLHVLDEAWSRQGQGLGTLVRYCDDFGLFCRFRGSVPGQNRHRPRSAVKPAAGRLTSSIMAGEELHQGVVKGRPATRGRPRLRRPLTTPSRGTEERHEPKAQAPG
jgi:hypothetical protein